MEQPKLHFPDLSRPTEKRGENLLKSDSLKKKKWCGGEFFKALVGLLIPPLPASLGTDAG